MRRFSRFGALSLALVGVVDAVGSNVPPRHAALRLGALLLLSGFGPAAAAPPDAAGFDRTNGAYCRGALGVLDGMPGHNMMTVTRDEILQVHSKILFAEHLGAIGDTNGALAEIDAALAVERNAPEAYVVRGAIWRQKGDQARAFADYLTEVCLDGQSVTGWIGFADLLQQAGNLRESVSAYSEALKINPALIDPRLKRAAAFLAEANADAAIADYDAVLKAEPYNAQALQGKQFASTVPRPLNRR